MARHKYYRCKRCFRAKSTDFYVSRNGLCAECAISKQTEITRSIIGAAVELHAARSAPADSDRPDEGTVEP